jgi:hypothetical protein
MKTLASAQARVFTYQHMFIDRNTSSGQKYAQMQQKVRKMV